MSKIAIIHGTPGSGKTTHCGKFKELCPEVEHLSIGDQLRAIKTGKVSSHYQEKILKQQEILAKSAPLDHEVVNGVVFEFIRQCPAIRFFLIDGYPRFIDQLSIFYKSLEGGGHHCVGVIHLEVSAETSLSRLTGRGERPGEEKVTEEFALWRYQEYQTYTIPTIATLNKSYPVVKIDAEPNMTLVWSAFSNCLQNFLFNKD